MFSWKYRQVGLTESKILKDLFQKNFTVPQARDYLADIAQTNSVEGEEFRSYFDGKVQPVYDVVRRFVFSQLLYNI